MNQGPTSPEPDTPPDAPTQSSGTQTVVVHPAPPPPRRRRMGAWIGWMGFVACAVLLMRHYSVEREYYDTTAGVRERFHSGNRTATDKIAIISVTGVILEGDGFVKQQIDRVARDSHVRAVVLRINSPGGTVTGSDYLYHHLCRLGDDRELPIVVSMGSRAAGGGYYLAMAVGDRPRSIFAEPTTTTGSIGVIVPHYDLSQFLNRFDIKNDSISSHPRKQLLSMTRAMSPDGRQIIQAYVNESFERFKAIVKRGRPALRRSNPDGALRDPETGVDLATGEIFTATRAKRFGLVDEIGFIEQAIDRAAELAGLEPNAARVVQFARPATLTGMLGFAQGPSSGSAWPPAVTWSQFLEWTVPRAYFLAQ